MFMALVRSNDLEKIIFFPFLRNHSVNLKSGDSSLLAQESLISAMKRARAKQNFADSAFLVQKVLSRKPLS